MRKKVTVNNGSFESVKPSATFLADDFSVYRPHMGSLLIQMETSHKQVTSALVGILSRLAVQFTSSSGHPAPSASPTASALSGLPRPSCSQSSPCRHRAACPGASSRPLPSAARDSPAPGSGPGPESEHAVGGPPAPPRYTCDPERRRPLSPPRPGSINVSPAYRLGREPRAPLASAR